MKRISVIIPCHNHADTIGRCLKSVFAQTFPEIEVIVVDDGSSDGLERALAPFRDRIRYVRQENRGGPAARNRGFRESSGQLVLFCDADIIWKKEAFALMATALEAHPEVAYAYGSFIFGWKAFPLGPFDPERLKRHNYIHTGSLMRRERFPGFDESLKRFQDWDLWLTMLERGDVGIWVPQTLCRVLTKRGGISSWLPKFVYRIPWGLLGWKPSRIRAYEQAAEIVRHKHRVVDLPEERVSKWHVFLSVFLFCAGAELLSFLTYALPAWRLPVLCVLGVGAVLVSLTDLRHLFLVAVAEAVIGSHGRLFFADVGGFSLSFRMVLFALLAAGWIIHTARGCSRILHVRHANLAGPLLLLVAAISLGVVRGLSRGASPGDLFADANGYAFLLLIPIGLDLFAGRSDVVRLAEVFAGAVAWLAAKNLLLLYLFSHAFGPLLTAIFTWQRTYRLSEITHLPAGAVRVFAASEVFMIPAVVLGMLLLWRAGSRRVWAWTVLMAAAFLLSLSRSFWLGTLVAAAGMLPVALRFDIIPPARFERLCRVIVGTFGIGLLALFTLAIFPWPHRLQTVGTWNVYGDRLLDASDAAVSSRWNMLPPLSRAIAESPVFGSGFGTVITYQSDDPRMHDLFKGGRVTTGAIEWQYLEIWLKMGLIGLFAIIWLWWRIGLAFWKTVKTAGEADRFLAMGLMLSFLAFVVANLFTPYVNHPLGWTYLALLIVGLHAIGEHESMVDRHQK